MFKIFKTLKDKLSKKKLDLQLKTLDECFKLVEEGKAHFEEKVKIENGQKTKTLKLVMNE